MTVSTVTDHSVNLSSIAQTVDQAISTSLNPQAATVLLEDGKTLRESISDYTSLIQEMAETLRQQDALLDYLDRELPKYHSNSSEDCLERARLLSECINEAVKLGVDVSDWLAVLKQKSMATPQVKENNLFGPKSLKAEDLLALLKELESACQKSSKTLVEFTELDKFKFFQKKLLSELNGLTDSPEHCELRGKIMFEFSQEARDLGLDVSGWTTSAADVKDFLVKPQKGLTLEEFPDVKAAFIDAFNNTKNKIYDTLTIVQSKVAEFRSIILSSESLTKKS